MKESKNNKQTNKQANKRKKERTMHKVTTFAQNIIRGSCKKWKKILLLNQM